MFSITKAKKYTSAETYKKIENYNKAIKSKQQYICHHKDEIINKKTGKPLYTLKAIEKTPAKYIELHREDELRGAGKYKHLPYNKIVLMSKLEHYRLHSAANNKIKELNGEFKKTRKKSNCRKYSCKGITSIIRKHYNNKITPKQLDKEMHYYGRYGVVSWEHTKIIKKTRKQILKENFLKEYNIKESKKTERFFKSNTWRCWASIQNSMKLPSYKLRLLEAKKIMETIEKLR
jgi:hypothetical protein